MKYINLFDMDGVLCESPFIDLVKENPDFKEQLRVGRTPQFIVKILAAPKLGWYEENLEWLEKDVHTTIIVSGRFMHQKKATEIWLRRNNIRYDRVALIPYIDWDTYLKQRKNYVRIIVDGAKKQGLIVRYFEDNETIYNWAKDFLDSEVLVVFKITDGELIKDE